MGRRDSDISLFDYGENLLTNNTSPDMRKPTTTTTTFADPDAPPTDSPYLLLLRGSDPNDKLVHKLTKSTSLVGPYKHSEQKQHDVVLYARDIRCPVCYIYKKVQMDEDQEINVDQLDFRVYIEPFDTMIRITVDGREITQPTLLTAGQLVSFGEIYLFMFKDPTTVKDVDLSLSWLNKVKEVNGNFSKRGGLNVVSSSSLLLILQ